MTACAHGMPTPLSCLDCMDEGALPPPPKPVLHATGPVFIARFDGRCPVCDRPIRAEVDQITAVDEGGYAHEQCAT